MCEWLTLQVLVSFSNILPLSWTPHLNTHTHTHTHTSQVTYIHTYIHTAVVDIDRPSLSFASLCRGSSKSGRGGAGGICIIYNHT